MLDVPRVSVIVPAFNEQGNIIPVVQQIMSTFSDHNINGEIILVDDGSQDNTWAEIQIVVPQYPNVRALRHPRNYGLSYALNTGFRNMSGDLAIFLPADLQFRADEVIPRMVNKLAEGFDVVVGRKEGVNIDARSIMSKLSNLLIRAVFQVPVRDMNSVRALRREVVDDIRLRSEWHALMIPIVATQGWRIGEVPVTVLPRAHGASKFRFKSFVFALFDLVTVRFLLTFGQRPMLLFGLIACSLFAIVGASAIIMVFDWFETQVDFLRPLLIISGGSFLAGLILILVGFLAELVATQLELLREQDRRLREIECELLSVHQKLSKEGAPDTQSMIGAQRRDTPPVDEVLHP